MTKSDLIEAIVVATPARPRAAIELAVNTVFDALSTALVRGERVEIRGLGSFRIKERAARLGRNPKTGEPVRIPGRRVPHFIVGKALRARVEEPA